MVTRAEEVGHALRQGIADGRFAGGARLNEADLAQTLGVSRTPVRSALSSLAAEGLLEYLPNSGYTVRRVTAEDFHNILRVRLRIEGLAAALAAENGPDPAQRQAFAQCLAQSGAMVAEGIWNDAVRAAWTQMNLRFHTIVYDAARNPYLAGIIQRANNFPIYAAVRFADFDAEELRRSHLDHVDLVDAITERQPERAERIQAEHVYRSGRMMLDRWARINAAAAPRAG